VPAISEWTKVNCQPQIGSAGAQPPLESGERRPRVESSAADEGKPDGSSRQLAGGLDQYVRTFIPDHPADEADLNRAIMRGRAGTRSEEIGVSSVRHDNNPIPQLSGEPRRGLLGEKSADADDQLDRRERPPKTTSSISSKQFVVRVQDHLVAIIGTCGWELDEIVSNDRRWRPIVLIGQQCPETASRPQTLPGGYAGNAIDQFDCPTGLRRESVADRSGAVVAIRVGVLGEEHIVA